MANSRAISVPRMLRQRAEVFRAGGIVSVGVLSGSSVMEITRPAKMLPHARRLIGSIMAGLDSFNGASDRMRGWSEKTKRARRKE